MSKKTEKNPYVGFTLAEVEHAEANHFYLQVGHEVPVYNGKQTFTKDKAEYLFFELFDSLVHMKQNGKKDERQDAHECLLNFKLHKLRIH